MDDRKTVARSATGASPVKRTRVIRLGVIADTHGFYDLAIEKHFSGVKEILHAGDIGSEDILRKLRQIAPVHAIVGNIDIHPLTSKHPATEVVEVAGKTFYMLHNLKALDLDPKAAGFAAVICGHSHKPEFFFENGVLFFNPGSAGPRRFSLPISVGRIRIEDGELFPEIMVLEE